MRTTPLTEPSSGQCSPVLACHRIWSRSFANSTMACEHACGSTTGCLRVVRCGTGPSPRVRVRALSVRHLLRGGYKRGLHTFQGGQRHHGRFGTPEEDNGGEGGGGGGKKPPGSQPRQYRFGILYAEDAGAVSQSTEHPRKMMGVIVVRGVWPHRIGGQD